MEEPIATRRSRRSLRAVNYKDLEKIKLPKVSVCKPKDKLYPVTVLEHDADKVKVHYVGFSEDHDEWREENELEALGEEEDEGTTPVKIHGMILHDNMGNCSYLARIYKKRCVLCFLGYFVLARSYKILCYHAWIINHVNSYEFLSQLISCDHTWIYPWRILL